MPRAHPSAAFDRLVSRLVRRDAARAYGMLVVGAAFLAIFVARAWPPHEIRAALVAADDDARALALGVAAGLYLLATAPIARRLLASRRLAYLRHLPVSPARWRWIHVRHLVGVNGPWLALAAYGLASPSLAAGIGERALLGVTWTTWTLAAQAALVHAGGRGSAIAGAVAVAAAGSITIVVASGSGIATAASAIAAVIAIARLLLRAPPEPPARALRWPWAPRRPALALARLDALSLLRRAPEVLRRRLLHALGLCSLGVAAIAAARGAGEGVDPGIVRASLILGAFFGAHLVVVAHRLVDRDRWYLDALEPSVASILGARLLTGIGGATPAILLWVAARIGIGGDQPIGGVMIEAALVGLLAAAAMTWAGARAEAERRLHGRIFGAPAGLALLGLGLWTAAGDALILAPLVAILIAASPGALRRAAATRRRLETGRRDDDHE